MIVDRDIVGEKPRITGKAFKTYRLSLPAGIAMVIFIFCSALLTLDSLRTWQARATILSDDKVETANLARSLAQHAHDVVQAADTILLGLQERAANDGLSAVSLQRLHQLMVARTKALPLIHGLFLYDADGNWLTNSLELTSPRLNNSNREYFQYHRTSLDPKPHLGRPVRSKSDGTWVITVSRRVSDKDGGFAGIVLATISIDYLNTFYATFDVGAHGVISLLTDQGILIARKSTDTLEIGTDLSHGQIFQDFLPQSPIGSFRYSPAIGFVERLGSYRRVADYPLVIVVAHGFDQVLADWRADAKVHLTIDLILIGALAFGGRSLCRQIEGQAKAERQYRLLADNSSDAITCVSLSGQRLYVSPAFTTLLGWSKTDALSRRLRSDVHPDDRHIVDDVFARLHAGEEKTSACYRYLCKDDRYLWTEAHFHLVPAERDQDAQFVINIRDISARKVAEDRLAIAHEQLAVQASTDGLTGLANRRRFDEVLQQEWSRAVRDQQPLSLLMIDIDRFKLFNDRYGHQKGDHCLRLIAAAVTDVSRRPADLTARYGGEELVMLLPNTDAAGAACVGEIVRSAIEASGVLHAGNLPFGVVTGSIGAATSLPIIGNKACSPEALVEAADQALYTAKRTGRNRVIAAGELGMSFVVRDVMTGRTTEHTS